MNITAWFCMALFCTVLFSMGTYIFIFLYVNICHNCVCICIILSVERVSLKKFNVLYIIRSLLIWEKGRKSNLIKIWIMEYLKNYIQIKCYFNWSVNYINEARWVRNYVSIELYYNIYHMWIFYHWAVY